MIDVMIRLNDDSESFRRTLKESARALMDRSAELERSHRIPGTQDWDDADAQDEARGLETLAVCLRVYASAARVRAVADITNQRSEINRLRDEACALGHVIVEAGVIPGVSYPCRCHECGAVAVKMDEAGYLDHIEDRWWKSES